MRTIESFLIMAIGLAILALLVAGSPDDKVYRTIKDSTDAVAKMIRGAMGT